MDKKFTLEDLIRHLDKRSDAFKDLVFRVWEAPHEWTLERWIEEYGKLPRMMRSRSRSQAVSQWNKLMAHGLVR